MLIRVRYIEVLKKCYNEFCWGLNWKGVFRVGSISNGFEGFKVVFFDFEDGKYLGICFEN